MGNDPEAITDFNRAIAINSNYIDAYINRAESRVKLRDFIRAITFGRASLNADFSRIISQIIEIDLNEYFISELGKILGILKSLI